MCCQQEFIKILCKKESDVLYAHDGMSKMHMISRSDSKKMTLITQLATV